MEKTQKNKPLIVRNEVKGTPFTYVRQNKLWYVTLGKYRLNQEGLNTEEDCNTYLIENQWLIVAQLCQIISEYTVNQSLNTKTNDNN